jgi:pyruvate/2-oxoglutarate dehydrogenase complex dihydrolipoamide acyltransferase (E2) component
MKTKLIACAATLGWCTTLFSATLSAPTAVQVKPDPASAVIVVLKAGTEQPTPSDKAGPAPAGWTAVEVSGPFEAYVKNKDLSKALDVVPGASVYLSPKDGSAVLTAFEKGDKAEITGLHGGWTQIRLEKTLIGFIQVAPVASEPVAAAAAAPVAPAPAPAPAPSASAASATPQEAANLARLFEGTLASSKSLLNPNRPFDWQLNDSDGNRIAYVDLTRLLLTDQIDNYAGHAVVVLGSLKPVADSKDLVIDAEGLRLK